MPSARAGFWRQAIAAGGAGALAMGGFLLLLLRDPLFCWNDDYALSILPVFADVARAWNAGEWPLLSPYSWACGNLAGEYQYGTFSVFVNAVVVGVWRLGLSLPATAAGLSAAHVFVLGAGAFTLARGRGLPGALALMVALVGALNGWIICWGATNWFGALAALAWLPWAWWALERALDPAVPRWRRVVLPAAFVYLLVAGGFPYTVVMLGVVTVWLALRAWWETRRVSALWPLAAGWALGLGLAAPAWLSLLEYIPGSARAGGEGVFHQTWVVPIAALPGLVLPSWTSRWINFDGQPFPHTALELAGGLVPLAGLLAAWAAGGTARDDDGETARRRPWRWDLALAGVALVLCLLPSAGMFRWSFRWLPLLHLALALAGAGALAGLQSRRDASSWWTNPGAWAVTLTGATWAVAAIIGWDHRGSGSPKLPLATLILCLGWCGAMAGTGGKWSRVLPDRLRPCLPALVTAGTLLVAYFQIPMNPGVPRYPLGENLRSPVPLSPERLYLSLYLEPHSHYDVWRAPAGFGAILRPGSTGMIGGVHLVNGYSPIRAAGVARRLHFDTHGQVEPSRVAALLSEEAGADGLLARLGVDGLIVARGMPLGERGVPIDEWEEVFSSDEGQVFHRRGPAHGEVSTRPGTRLEFATATLNVLESTRGRMVVDVHVPPGDERPARLAFRRPFYPGYRAVFRLEGERSGSQQTMVLPVGSEDGLLPIVDVPGGRGGRLTLSYRPQAVTWGAGIAAMSATLVILLGATGWVDGGRARAERTGPSR